MGPPAVSMALNRLRHTLDDPLFVRSGKEMVPTPRAAALWNRVGPALSEIDAAVRRDRFEPETTTTLFRIAVADNIETGLVPQLFRYLAGAAPGARLSVLAVDFIKVYDRLDRDEAELAVTALPSGDPPPRHRVETLAKEGFSVLYDPVQLPRTGPLTMEEFLETPQILLSTRADYRGPIDAALSKRGLERRLVGTVTHFPALPPILKQRLAMACVPTTTAAVFAQQFDLTVADLPFPSPTFAVGMAWHRKNDQDPARIWFRDRVRDRILAAYANPPGP